MADTKGKTPEVKTQADASKAAFTEQEAAASSPQQQYIAIGRLRRDTMILGSSDDADEINKLAAEAVRQGRAAEVYVVQSLGYFSESEVDFVEAPVAARALRADQTDSRVPLLNPSTGEQSLDNSDPSASTAVKAQTPSGGASGEGDDNNGAGTGTGNTDSTADANK